MLELNHSSRLGVQLILELNHSSCLGVQLILELNTSSCLGVQLILELKTRPSCVFNTTIKLTIQNTFNTNISMFVYMFRPTQSILRYKKLLENTKIDIQYPVNN